MFTVASDHLVNLSIMDDNLDTLSKNDVLNQNCNQDNFHAIEENVLDEFCKNHSEEFKYDKDKVAGI